MQTPRGDLTYISPRYTWKIIALSPVLLLHRRHLLEGLVLGSGDEAWLFSFIMTLALVDLLFFG